MFIEKVPQSGLNNIYLDVNGLKFRTASEINQQLSEWANARGCSFHLCSVWYITLPDELTALEFKLTWL
jgi:hypothetical protein